MLQSRVAGATDSPDPPPYPWGCWLRENVNIFRVRVMVERQQLFNSLWLSLTTAILTTQPVWANTILVTAVRIDPTDSGMKVILESKKSATPTVFTSSYGKTFVADIVNTQLRVGSVNNFRQDNPADGIAAIAVTSLTPNSIRVAVTGKDGVPLASMRGGKEGLVLSLKASSNTSVTQASIQPLVNDTSSNASKNSDEQTALVGYEERSLDRADGSKLDAIASNIKYKDVARETQQGQQTTRSAAASRQQSVATNSLPQVNPTSVNPGPRPSRQAPNYLNPTPNPLQFPTKIDEVRIQGTEAITLQQALELARRNNRTLQAAEQTLQRSQVAVREASSARYPTLDATTGINRQQSTGGELSSQRSPLQTDSDTPSTSANANLRLSYDLYTSGERSARIRAAEEQVRFNELEVERQKEELRLNVFNDYYGLQGADQQVRINLEAVRNAEASLRQAQALEQAGVGTRFDVLRSQVQLANATQDLTNARSQQQVARRQLVQRLSLAQSVDITAADPVQVAGRWNLSLEESIVLAFQNRADLQQQLVQRNINEQQRRIALSALLPKVNLEANYNVLNVFNDRLERADGYSLGANIRMNLFDGGAARARAEQEETNKAISETRFADQRNQIRFQVEESYANLQSNFANISTADVALSQARESLRLARLRFQAGIGTQTDVINAENELTRAQGNLVNAILNYNRSLATLQRSVSSGAQR
ncbi:TolC family protein [Microcoleus sp. FACHB-831]|uniref:TolC family protein n=1 Tax=Microcoleus sp. FACHB-831 TaxID=2692827 RepID=UPI0018EFA7FD|nr:TolC family protein [Microcoleus sp. FACHB-831]